MTKRQCESKVRELIKNLRPELLKESLRLFSSGAVDVTAYPEDSYILPKLLITTALHNLKDSFAPMYPGFQKELKNLRHF